MKPTTSDTRLVALTRNKAVIEKNVCKLQHAAIKETRSCPFNNNIKIWNKLKKMNKRLNHVNKQLLLLDHKTPKDK